MKKFTREGCVIKPYWGVYQRKRHTPKDETIYLIPLSLIKQTEKSLLEYESMIPSNEGMVYWAGIKNENIVSIQTLVAPSTDTMWGRVDVSHKANAAYVKTICELDQIHLAQVHSHPSDWVDHSLGDDDMAAFKIKGLVSIVVPDYGKKGMLPLTVCGVHRLEDEFIRLSDAYVKSHFEIDANLNHVFVDLR